MSRAHRAWRRSSTSRSRCWWPCRSRAPTGLVLGRPCRAWCPCPPRCAPRPPEAAAPQEAQRRRRNRPEPETPPAPLFRGKPVAPKPAAGDAPRVTGVPSAEQPEQLQFDEHVLSPPSRPYGLPGDAKRHAEERDEPRR